MDYIGRNLDIIAQCIRDNQYVELETERLEFKDLSTGENWLELYKTVCAFLNSNGGIIVIGIKDKNNEKDKAKRHYRFTGFNYDNEPKLKEISQLFTNAENQKVNLNSYFLTPEIRDFKEGKVAIIYVDELPR